MSEMLKFKHDLDKDPEVAKQVRLDGSEAVDNDVLAMQLVKADMLFTHGKLIELKAWVCMFTELHNYHVHDDAYMKELIRLHARWHVCSLVPRTIAIEVNSIFGRHNKTSPSDPRGKDSPSENESLPQPRLSLPESRLPLCRLRTNPRRS
ncbi:hypothetical protein B0H16DRAFT_286347 [Mycena metata]|uniref:Uncharacterized protein n=1 Tax=Mycena metata TaxID=1033252 RepID=A0AAD7HPX1_9AGAR|nr:hypothetical protein B0H16DRAFT_286347 [Mycena metata]